MLWDHIFDKSSDVKPALIICAKLIIYNMKELAKPPEAKVALKRSLNSQENQISKMLNRNQSQAQLIHL